MFLNLVNHILIFFYKFRWFQIRAYFFFGFRGCWVISKFMIFFAIKCCKTYLGPILPPGNRSRQLIYPNYFSFPKQKRHLRYLLFEKCELSKVCQILPLPNFAKFCQTLPNVAKCCQILPYFRNCQFINNEKTLRLVPPRDTC